MKPRSTARLSFPLATAIAALLAAQPVHAANLYWDIDGATAGAGGTSPSSTWDATGSVWSTSANGSVATSAVTTALTDDLFLSAGIDATGTYDITLSDSQSAQSLTFQDGTATISGTGGVINLGGTGIMNVPNSITLSPLSATIGANTNTIIAGSAGLTKIGVGTLTLSGTTVNTVTGGLNVNGGTLALNFANLATPTDLVNSGNVLTLGGGRLLITGKGTGTTNQTLGSVTVTSGAGGILGDKNDGDGLNITLGTLTTTASGGSLLVGAGGTNANLPVITTTTGKDATGIYGGRVVYFDGTANTGYDWATTADASPGPYSLSPYAGYSALDTTTTGDITDTNNSRITDGAVLPAASNRTTNSLKFENPGANSTLDIGTGNTLTLTSGGLLMTGGNNNISINNGSITAGDGLTPADLVVHQFNPAQPLAVGLTGTNLGNTPEIASIIANNNGQPVTLVKNGPGSVRFIGANTFTGGVIVNQGSVDFGNLSLNNNPITFNANGFLYTNGAHATTGGIALNNGSQVTICNNNSSFTVNANVTGSGGLSAANGGQGAMTLTLNGTANTFTGPVRFAHSNGTQQCTINVASLPDTDTFGTGNITFGTGAVSSTSQNFGLASTAVAPLTLSNRRFEMAGNNVNQQINNNSTQALTINNDLLVTGSQGKNLQLGGTGTGLSTFAGVIANHTSPTTPGTVPNGERKTASGTTLTLGSVEGIAVGATITGTFIPAGTTITAINPLTRVVTLSQTYTAANNSNFNVGVLYSIPNVMNTVSLTKAGTSTWVVSGNNTYTGPTNITAGAFNIQHANALGSTTIGTLVASGATLTLQGGINYAAEALTLTNSTSNTPLLTNISGNNTWNGTITTTGNPASSFSRIQSDADTLTLAGTIDSTTNNNGAVVLQGAGAINVTGQVTGAAGLISGSVNAGAGSIRTLSHPSNTYTGATAINGGTLVITGATQATSAITFGGGILGLNIASSVTAASATIDFTGQQVLVTGSPSLPSHTLLTASSITGTPTLAALVPGYTLVADGSTLKLNATGGSNKYASWANDPLKGNIPGEPASGDFDNDGITNIIEYALGMNPRVSTQPAGVFAGNTITFTKGADAIANGDVKWIIETSEALLSGSWTDAVTQNAGDPAATLSYTFTPGSPVKKFARLKVTQVP